ncbi:MAG: imidazole glycerol phosphate synthase subunit HisH [Bacteroidia bacterium]
MVITIIDYNVGNIQSIVNMLRKIGHAAVVTKDPEVINKAGKLILPGVGAFDYGMEQLRATGLIPVITRKTMEDHIPFLGICLGAQLLLGSSEEGQTAGLDFLPGKVIRFKAVNADMKIPHMGWNEVTVEKPSPLFNGLETDARFYFVHAYHFEMEKESDMLTTSTYGYTFCSSFSRDNIYGVQFHPEKSHKFGMKLLKNFAENC